MRQWNCIGHDPTTWGLGEVKDGLMHNIVGRVQRRKYGKWMFFTDNFSGAEPSRIEAIKTVNNILKEYQR